MIVLKIDSFALPVCAGFEIEQQYAPIGPASIRRAVSGRGIKQRTYRRTRIVTSGNGWVPSGLQSLDFDAQHELSCVTPETVPAVFATRQATLPATRRADAGHLPYGLAQMADGHTVLAGVTMAGNVATVDAVAGAVAYQAGYFPKFTVWLNEPTRRTGNAWELIAEEV